MSECLYRHDFYPAGIFVLVAEYQSFTLAAKQLNITQSAVSYALKSLEKHGISAC
ncbi:helix-turn-helix domain-containing protein [Acinetobacter sp.]|uniref:helix-turn-helix domain-containing protein n=1 Tax=Acinetobacter sp. TaxID=472 RepID=UPI003FCEB0E8